MDILWRPEISLPLHPNAMFMESISAAGFIKAEQTIYSVAGGKTIIDACDGTEAAISIKPVYELSDMTYILQHLGRTGQTFWEFVEEREGPGFWDYLDRVWKAMKASVERGIETEGVLPGALHLPRKASSYFVRANSFKGSLKRRSMLFAFALAVAEENDAGGQVVTAPTCGSCEVLPGVLYTMSRNYGFTEGKILIALATGGLIGNLVKKHASISRAQVGCQGEIGTACSMATAGAAQLLGGPRPRGNTPRPRPWMPTLTPCSRMVDTGLASIPSWRP